MSAGEILDYLKNNNNDCSVEDEAGAPQRALLVATPGGFGDQVAPFQLRVNKGEVVGHSVVDKFGENPDIDTGTTPEDLWEYGGEYIFDLPGTAPIISVVSDSALDIQEIEIPTGLDVDGNQQYQTVTLNGTTRVALDIPLWRFNRGANLGSIGEEINGTVYFYTGTSNVPAPSEIRGIIDNGNNQTLMAIFTIPLGKVGYLWRGEVGGSRSQNNGAIQASYYSRRVGKVFRIKKRVDTTVQGNSLYQDYRSFPDIIPALTDIKLTVEDVSANNTGVFGTFDILLVDEDQLDSDYLVAIGQPSEMPT